MITLSIIVVNFNGQHLIEDCLTSIFESQTSFEHEVIVIDNHSTDDSLQLITQFKHPLVLIQNKNNLGFAVANNQGLSMAKGRYIFFLNNDTKITPTTLEKMFQYYEQHPTIGALAPQLIKGNGKIDCPGSIFTAHHFRANHPKPMPFLSGAAFWTTKDILDKTKGFDENFFFYNEDLDLSKQVKKLGYALMILPQASIIHYGGEASKTISSRALIEGYRGGLYLVYKHYPRGVYHLYRCLLFLVLFITSLMYLMLYYIQKDARIRLAANKEIMSIILAQKITFKVKK